MRRIPRRGLQRQANRLGDLVIADPARRAGARLVEEAINPALGEPSPPFANRVGGCVDAQADVLVLRPSAAKRTMRARCASPCAVFRRDAKLSSSRRSLCVRSIATAVFPIAKSPRNQSAKKIAHICRSGH
jgi:hypothetical protein